MTPQNAELIAIQGLQYLAGDEEQLGRFLALSGCEPTQIIAQIRVSEKSSEFLQGVLEFFMGNEATLLAFCAHHSINPTDISTACQVLNGDGDNAMGHYESHSI